MNIDTKKCSIYESNTFDL